MILLIDNYDSFTYNLYQYLLELGKEVRVVKNDQITLAEVCEINPESIVISPGPGTPDEAGVSLAIIQKFSGKIPILGICLGHQAIVQAFGGEIVRAPEPVHGKTSIITNDQEGVFTSLSARFSVTRYHSLIASESYFPSELVITAKTEDDLIMAVRHREFLVEGVQFHPEAILSEHGHEILKNFVKLTERSYENENAVRF
ncbi:anthranilate synthase component II [Paenilisteria rocourtiae]|uniref:Anthranilate synthase component II n=1 Tax=Listeria rocourtiae TaxID=647910 RepID=A0A4R6ZL22_9LIST|nr:aminodeoxychorismate/anthranilate synthase component II [Listeria rocourtiae]EUJ42969.1 anthranilate synthase component II [Listeria rocourtiae FSL F6-920]MBC1435009.1 aminodeoxychorismate/anthranilate synthase component II [Listeria rocourtiae]MBC1604824.1 aminodeoxychorismate/anthranilate synthase component II [Listeria rocourtiae]TDR53090.1 anthranilate synthase component II [Listeria rocourtiae]